MSRWLDALYIQGACNPRGIARALVKATDEVATEGDTNAVRADPAVRLMVHQLAYLAGMENYSWGWDEAVRVCRERYEQLGEKVP